MTAYIKLSTLEYPRHIGDIEIDSAGLSDYQKVEWVDPPAYDPVTQKCFEDQPRLIDGVYVMQWSIRDATPEEIKDYLDPPTFAQRPSIFK